MLNSTPQFRYNLGNVEELVTEREPVPDMEAVKVQRIRDLYRSAILGEEDIEIQFDSSPRGIEA